MSGYVLARAAQRDLEGIDDWYSERMGVHVAATVARGFARSFDRLAEWPELGFVRPDWTRWPVRFWPIHRWLIVYNPAEKPLVILRVLAGAQDVPSQLIGPPPTTTD